MTKPMNLDNKNMKKANPKENNLIRILQKVPTVLTPSPKAKKKEE